ncbi:trypsin-like peptidase domain-containing protein [Subtercola endophyticus]|uniref:trypsin-like peptidase domain-containing protein n=1 Tax=Subtercola endophyticus TaxID=2895559 RepID=UPI001E47A90E|nr:trypsin-like peptidase domain-containing protein [Subtercola endophyticus]UFS60082.1 trypsin-like peptidase domain-containing protein [Subtercola endophyticus]
MSLPAPHQTARRRAFPLGRSLALALIVGGAVVASGGAFGSVSPAHAAPADLPQEQIAAIGEAGTVYLSGTWSGFVNFPKADGSTAWSDEVDASFSCSGFVASSDGSVVTAGHCADVEEGKTSIVDEFLSSEVANGDITQDDAAAYVAAGAETNWPVEGQSAGQPPVLAMKVYPAITITADDSTSYPAVLVDDRPLGQGDVALFKIDTPSPLPVLVVSQTQPATGQQVDAIGYPGNVTSLVSGNPEPTFAQGQVSGRQQTDGGPFTQIGVAMSPGMSGGPVVDGTADVVGTVSFGPSSDTQQLNFAAAPETISALLSRNGVKNELGDGDKQFRAGLDEYFAGKYHAAADDLGKALATNPDNAIAQQYQTKAIAAFPQENTTGWVLWVVLGGAALLLVVVVIVVLLVVRASRRRRRGAVVAAGQQAAAWNTAAPDAAVPNAAVPNVVVPNPVMPDAAVPGVAVPDAAVPSPVVPDAAVPSPVVPNAAVPQTAGAPVMQMAGAEAEPMSSPDGTTPLPAPAVDAAPPFTAPPVPAAVAPEAAVGRCGSCGVQNTSDARFCASCGHPLG